MVNLLGHHQTFFLWVILTGKVYWNNPGTGEDLKENIQREVNVIPADMLADTFTWSPTSKFVNVSRIKVGVITHTLSHNGHWKFNMAPHGKELSEDLKKRSITLHKDGRGYKKIAKPLKLSCGTVAKTIQRFDKYIKFIKYKL